MRFFACVPWPLSQFWLSLSSSDPWSWSDQFIPVPDQHWRLNLRPVWNTQTWKLLGWVGDLSQTWLGTRSATVIKTHKTAEKDPKWYNTAFSKWPGMHWIWQTTTILGLAILLFLLLILVEINWCDCGGEGLRSSDCHRQARLPPAAILLVVLYLRSGVHHYTTTITCAVYCAHHCTAPDP